MPLMHKLLKYSKEDFVQFTGYIEDIRVKNVCQGAAIFSVCHNAISR